MIYDFTFEYRTYFLAQFILVKEHLLTEVLLSCCFPIYGDVYERYSFAQCCIAINSRLCCNAYYRTVCNDLCVMIFTFCVKGFCLTEYCFDHFLIHKLLSEKIFD